MNKEKAQALGSSGGGAGGAAAAARRAKAKAKGTPKKKGTKADWFNEKPVEDVASTALA